MKIHLLLTFLFITTVKAQDLSCDLLRFNFIEKTGIVQSVQSQRDRSNSLAKDLKTKSLVSESDLKILNDLNHDEWFDRFGKIQTQLRSLIKDKEKNIKYIGLDDQGLLIQQEINIIINGLERKLVITTSSKKVLTLDELLNAESILVSITEDGKSFTSEKEYIQSHLPSTCSSYPRDDLGSEKIKCNQ